jgi:hypothetical protein
MSSRPDPLCGRCRQWYTTDGICPHCDGRLAWRKAQRNSERRRIGGNTVSAYQRLADGLDDEQLVLLDQVEQGIRREERLRGHQPQPDAIVVADLSGPRVAVAVQPRDWERLFTELRDAVEECDQKAITHDDEDGFVKFYLLTTGPWHRVLTKARAW